MSTKEKLIARFKRLPNDFTWEELVRLFAIFGFTVDNKGKTSGSRVLFVTIDDAHTVHKPHQSNTIKKYAMKQVFNFLLEKGYIQDKKHDN